MIVNLIRGWLGVYVNCDLVWWSLCVVGELCVCFMLRR